MNRFLGLFGGGSYTEFSVSPTTDLVMLVGCKQGGETGWKMPSSIRVDHGTQPKTFDRDGDRDFSRRSNKILGTQRWDFLGTFCEFTKKCWDFFGDFTENFGIFLGFLAILHNILIFGLGF